MENAAQEKDMQKTIKISEKQQNEIKVSRQIASKLKMQWEELAKRQRATGHSVRSGRRITSISFTRDHHGKIAVQVNLRNGHSIKDNQTEKALETFKDGSRQAYARAKIKELLDKIREHGFAAVEGEIPAELKAEVLRSMAKANISTSYQGKKANAAKVARNNANEKKNDANNAHKKPFGPVALDAGAFGKGTNPRIRKKRKDSNSLEVTFMTENGETKLNGDRINTSKIILDEGYQLFKMLESGTPLNEDQKRRLKEWEKRGVKSTNDFKPGKDGKSKASKQAGSMSNKVTAEFKALLKRAANVDKKRLTECAKIGLEAKLEQLDFIIEQKKNGKQLSPDMEKIYNFGKLLLPSKTEATPEAMKEAMKNAKEQIKSDSLPKKLEEIGRCQYFLKDENKELLSKEGLEARFEKFTAGEIKTINIPLDVKLVSGKNIEDITNNARSNRKNGVETKDDKILGQYINAVQKIFDEKELTPKTKEMAENLKSRKANLGDLYKVVKNHALTQNQKKELLLQLGEKTKNNPEKPALKKEQKHNQAPTVVEETKRVTGKLEKIYARTKKADANIKVPQPKTPASAKEPAKQQPQKQTVATRRPLDAMMIAQIKKRNQGR